MCLPLAAVAIGASIASAATSAYGSIQQGQAQAGAANYNAKMAVAQSESQSQASLINAQQTFRQGDQLEGAARARLAANGVALNSGTALGTQTDIAQRTGENVANEQYNARLGLWGGLNQSVLDRTQAGFDVQAGDLGAASSLLSGAGQVAGKWQSAFGSSASPPLQGPT